MDQKQYNYHEETLSSKELYSGRVFRIELDEVRLPNGKTGSREVVRHNGGVTVLALDESDNILFVRQHRYAYGEVLLELPAGKREPGEDPALCGMRELEEETGYRAGKFEPLGRVYPSPGYVDEVLYLYLATELEKTTQKLDEDEFLTVEKIPLEEAVELCMNGGIVDAKTMVSILKYDRMRGR